MGDLHGHRSLLERELDRFGFDPRCDRVLSTGGGLWIRDALARHRKTVGRLAERLAAMPLALHVDADMPFNVTHTDLRPIGPVGSGSVAVHEADRSTSSRKHAAEALKAARLYLQFAQHPVQVSATPLADTAITYVGHSPLEHVTVHQSHVYIDQRVCAGSSGHAADTPPTVLEHRKFAFWLGGVALADPRTALRMTTASPVTA